MQQNDTDRLSSVRLHKNRRSLKLLWRHESSSSSMKEVEKAWRLLNQESSTTFTSRKLKDHWHFPLMTAVWNIQLQNGMNHHLLVQWGGESSNTNESSKLKDLWLLLTPTAVWQIQLQISIIFFRNEVEKKLKDYYNSVKKAQRWLASSTVTGSMAPPKLQNRSLWTYPKINLQQSVFENHTLMRSRRRRTQPFPWIMVVELSAWFAATSKPKSSA